MDIENAFKILSLEEIKKSRVFKKYGMASKDTDFSVLNNNEKGSYWTSSKEENISVKTINCDGKVSFNYVTVNPIGCRPVISYSFIKNFAKVIDDKKFGVLEIEYGEYPKDFVSSKEKDILEKLYKNNSLNKTKKTYSISTSTGPGPYFDTKISYDEYEYNGEKYIMVDSKFDDFGKIEKRGIRDWIKVEPVRFLVDKKLDFAITKDIVFSGVCFTDDSCSSAEQKKTYLYKYLNEVFAKDIVPSNIYTNSVNINEDTDIYIKLSGGKYQLIEILKKLNDELVNVELLDEKDIIRKR